jgi:hypothetical protein
MNQMSSLLRERLGEEIREEEGGAESFERRTHDRGPNSASNGLEVVRGWSGARKKEGPGARFGETRSWTWEL